MSETLDELAGVVDLFGALTREELSRALTELAFKQRREPDEEAVAAAIDDAVAAYYLVPFERNGEALLAVGPVAFPALPENGADLPHIMDVPERDVDRAELGAAVEQRLREEAAAAVAAGDEARAETLLDVSYDLEAWAPVAVEEVRAELDAALQD